MDAYPLDDYLAPPRMQSPSWPPGVQSWFRGRIDGMPRDDDMDYPVLNLLAAERHGFAVTARDVARLWLGHLPYEGVYTAERIAYRNLVDEVDPPESGRRFNPYREWIGAQIRADLWGYLCPGQPERAASLAWQDASVSHTGNGIYGEMFTASLVAAALTASNVDEALDAALQEIPARSRFSEMVTQVRGWARDTPDPEVCRDRIEGAFGGYHWVHTLNNGAVVVMALSYSGGDFSRGIGLAVTGGWDTDCNGATVGSVLGALGGTRGIPSRWTEPLHDRLHTYVIGETDTHFSSLAARTRAVTGQVSSGSL
jgi:ADP-ribosylglycohydrolase